MIWNSIIILIKYENSLEMKLEGKELKLEEIIKKQIMEKEEQETDAERKLDKRLNESLNRAADRGATVEVEW